MPTIFEQARIAAWTRQAQRHGWNADTAKRLAFQRWRWQARQPAQRVCRLPTLHPPVPWESH